MQKFIESLKAGKLTTSKCLSCKNIIWPPSNVCPKCLSDSIEWVEVGSTGKLLDFSESMIASKPAICGIVQLNEGICLLGRIICNDGGIELKKGSSVKLTKCGMEDNDVYYEFQPM